MANTIKIKRSSVAGNTPGTTDLDVGELALNMADKKLFFKNGSNSVLELNGSSTDEDNVRAAGALMDDEIPNLGAVKTFDPTDYATAAQGTTADNALPKAGGTMTGNLDLNNYTLSDVKRIGFNAGGVIAAFKDEDDMASNNSLAAASQQSIKAYVDNSFYDTRVANFYNTSVRSSLFVPLAGYIVDRDSPPTGVGEYIGMIAPFDGELIQVQLRSELLIRDGITVELVVAEDNTEIPATSKGSLVHDYSTIGLTDDTTDLYDFTGTLDTGVNTFNKGDVLGIKITMDGANNSKWYDTYCSCTFKYNTTT